MSRAFVKEEDANAPVVLPDRPISDHPNYMTREGRTAICQQVERLARTLSELEGNEEMVARTRRAEVTRDLRYLRRRLETGELVVPDNTDRVRFGHWVSFVDEAERTHRFRIVGEDEADPASGKLFYRSPLATALIGREVGDITQWRRGDQQQDIEITAIELLS